jgi:hypothetical protein
MAIILAVYGFLIFSFAVVSFLVVNRAIAVRRIHDANMQILAPHISQNDFSRLRGQFAGVNTKEEYNAIRLELERLAMTKGLRLRIEKTE